MKQLMYGCFVAFVTSIVTGIVFLFIDSSVALGFFILATSFAIPVFKDTMNVLQAVGPLYWITRDNGTKGIPFISPGFMREIDEPWRTGKGIQVRLFKYVFQLGLCRKNPNKNEEEGLLFAMKGRDMKLKAKEISSW